MPSQSSKTVKVCASLRKKCGFERERPLKSIIIKKKHRLMGVKLLGLEDG
jgi:hypothetical protein